jgi:hypothetical protein
MSSTLENQQETAEKMFYAAVGAPVVIGQKAKDFGMAIFNETTFEDLETAGRELANQIQDAKVVEQIQETVDVEQFQEKVDLLREQLETLLTSWRDQFDPSVKRDSVKIEVDEPAPKKTAGTAKKTTSTAKSTAKKTTSDK